MSNEHEIDPHSMQSVRGGELKEIAVTEMEASIASIFPEPENVEHILNPLGSQLVLRVEYHTASGKKVELMYNEESVKHMGYLTKQYLEVMNQDR